jgi:hypothetical protein
MRLLVTWQIIGRLVPRLALVLVPSLVGCGDAVANRQVTIRQFESTLDKPGGLPFDVDASHLPPEWGNVETTNRQGFLGPETDVRVPMSHRIRIVLMPTTQDSHDTSAK